MHPCWYLGLTGKDVRAPILFTAGSSDVICEDGCGYDLYEQVSAHPKVFFDVKGAGHMEPCNMGRRSEVDPKETLHALGQPHQARLGRARRNVIASRAAAARIRPPSTAAAAAALAVCRRQGAGGLVFAPLERDAEPEARPAGRHRLHRRRRRIGEA